MRDMQTCVQKGNNGILKQVDMLKDNKELIGGNKLPITKELGEGIMLCSTTRDMLCDVNVWTMLYYRQYFLPEN